ncbi:MAG: CHRD domain-containing protein [bacterium]
MHRFARFLSATVTLLALVIPATSSADDNDRRLRTELSGFNEVTGPGVGAIFTTGDGRLTLKIDKRRREIAYELTYAFPDAAATPINGAQFVNQAHLHFGQKHTTGGINVWLCQSADNPAPPAVAADTPTCPSPSGTVAETITPAKVLALAPQGFPAGEDGFDALLEAIRREAIYGNVHTDKSPGGEIRGQLGDHDD